MEKIFENVNINSAYYIFIIEILPDYLIRNVYRKFSYSWNRILNQNKIDNAKHEFCNIKLKNNIKNIQEKNRIKDILISELEYLKKNNKKSINFFITCINDFFI